MSKDKQKNYEKPRLKIHGDLKVMTEGSVSGGTETYDMRKP